MDDNSYPVYRRRDNGRTFVKGGFEYDNKWVVPYNPYLSAKYDAHINVEIATSITSVKYLYKYVYKGGDRAIAEIQRQRQEQGQQPEIDETKLYIDGRYVSASEGKFLSSSLNFWEVLLVDYYSCLLLDSLLEDLSFFYAPTQPRRGSTSASPSGSACGSF